MDVCMLYDSERNLVFKGQRLLSTGTITYDWSDGNNTQLQVTLFTPEMARKQQKALQEAGYETEIVASQGFGAAPMTPVAKFMVAVGAFIAGAFLMAAFL